MFQNEFLSEIREVCPSCNAPIVFVSAKSGEGLDGLLKQILALQQRLQTKISTGPINRILQKLTTQTPPTSYNGKHFKIYYAVQTGINPLTLQVFCNRKLWMPNNYQRFLENAFRKHFNLDGCPLVWNWVEKSPKEIYEALPQIKQTKSLPKRHPLRNRRKNEMEFNKTENFESVMGNPRDITHCFSFEKQQKFQKNQQRVRNGFFRVTYHLLGFLVLVQFVLMLISLIS